MKKNRQILKIIIVIILIYLGYYNQDTIIKNSFNLSLYNNSNSYDFKNIKIKYNFSENLSKNIKVEFCPSKNCYNLITNELKNAKTDIKCAFFDLGNIGISNILLNKSKYLNISLIIDDKYLKEKALRNLANSTIKISSDLNRKTRFNNYMHNKFCVIDKKIVITGSMNPTNNGIFYNNNNLLKIPSRYLAENYINEFNQMSANIYGTNKKSVLKYNNLTLNYKNNIYKISSYFCPENNCENEILKILNKSKKNIFFASFVLTSKPISNLLILKSSQNINVTGIIETKNRNTRGSKYLIMKKHFKVLLDKNKHNMHNKYFIVDDKYLITGSMNPSSSGNKYNDENILVIENKDLVLKYKSAFLKMIS